jgi:hypothetical protein
MAEGIGMRNLLMEKKPKVVNQAEGPNIEMASVISRMSERSIILSMDFKEYAGS